MDLLDGQNEYDWSNLEPSKPDSYQGYVFFAHLVVCAIISTLSFFEGLFFWCVGPGVLTPILLSGTGLFYAILPGINWYRTEFIPYLNRIHLIPEFETDRFLNYKRVLRLSALMFGYLATAISQIVWYEGVSFALVSFGPNTALLELLFYVFFAMIVFYLTILLLFFFSFEHVLKSIFSDVHHIITLDDKMTAYFRALEKAKKEKEKEAKKKKAKEEENKSFDQEKRSE
ncbi:MAG: hypothetical protein AM326_04430 [Candidatus Thorarchaeota archaeon SMTZ-45]|nr:MAG: hypothetical protein AM326_04430 [Candidatus Thorarchaeota archaeon SMTZ-45]KXH74372.1 MAG: hypothetical protein AM325_06010 [Candidatus Thorarchaeota archaeon SMTZ1-45]